jgi:ABC-type nitrate/sulfonate/bicarbonate transport system substrate-binding protein
MGWKRALAAYAATVLLVNAPGIATAATPEATAFRVGYYPATMIGLPLYVAIARGSFAAKGLDVTAVNFSAGPNLTSALLSGSIDGGLNGFDIWASLIDRKQKIKVVVMNQALPATLVVTTRVKLPHLSEGYPAVMADLVGTKLKIGVSGRGASAEYYSRMLLKAGGIDPDAWTWVACGSPGDCVAAMKAGVIDADVFYEPGATLAVGQGIGNVVADYRLIPPYSTWQYNGYAFREDVIAKNGQAMCSFQRVMEDTYTWMQDPQNFEQLLAIAGKFIPIDPKLLEQMVRTNVITARTYQGTLSMDSFDRWMDFTINQSKTMTSPIRYSDAIYSCK